MKIFKFRSEVRLDQKLSKVFPFFADAFNLETLTPAWLKFRVLSPKPISIKEGTRIGYRLQIHGLPVRWVSEIVTWEPPYRFIDQQIRGPYRLWIHEHRFLDDCNGTVCQDTVRYSLWGGALVNHLLVKKKIEHIFDYRQKKLRELLE